MTNEQRLLGRMRALRPESQAKRSASLRAWHRAKFMTRVREEFGEVTPRELDLMRRAQQLGYRQGYQKAYQAVYRPLRKHRSHHKGVKAA